MEYGILILFHLLGAAVWTGGHLVLALSVLPLALKERNPEIIHRFEERYERVGIPALVVQILTGLRLAMLFQPNVSEWFQLGDRVSAHIALKLGLLAVTLVLALHARLRLVPRLNRDNLGYLAGHIVAVTVLAVSFVLVGVSLRIGGFVW